MLTIACVYKSGGDFDLSDVARLAVSVEQHVKVPHRFICLTDITNNLSTMMPDGSILDIESFPLMYDWPGWWAKMQLFQLVGPVVYLDLDTLIVSNIDKLCQWVEAATNEVLMLRGFYRGDHCSGVMGWNRDMRWLTRRFADLAGTNAQWVSLPHGIGLANYRGDQEYIYDQLHVSRATTVFAQTIQPGIYSYKVNIQASGVIPADASIICFHGRPRPNEIKLESLKFEGAVQ